jgi:membrane protein DedA with SNARE-associated domain
MLGCIICFFLGYFNRGNIRSRAKTQINQNAVDDIQEMLRDISLFDR